MSPDDTAMLQQIQDRLDTLRLANEYAGISYHDAEVARLSWVVNTVASYDNTVKILEDFIAQAGKIIEDYVKSDMALGFPVNDKAVELLDILDGFGLYEQEGL